MGDLAAYDPSILTEKFGLMGTQYHLYAHGIDHSEVSESHTIKSVSRETTFEEDTSDAPLITDTVNQNSIKGRSIRSNYKIPTITNTITIQHYEKPKAKLFIGGGLDLSPSLAPIGAHAGLLLNTKKDQLIGLQVGTGANGGTNFGFSSYWKIKFK